MPDAPHGARVPRAVAGVPPPALADGEAVAKAWLLELVAEAPLERAAAVPVAELAARGPQLCAALLAAVGSAAELERLGPGGDRPALPPAAGLPAGATDPAGPAGARPRGGRRPPPGRLCGLHQLPHPPGAPLRQP